MCCFDTNGVLELGDLKTQTVEEVFSYDPAITQYQQVYVAHKNGEHGGTICESCDQRNSDKSDVMVYSSTHDIKERVGLTSTTYGRLNEPETGKEDKEESST